MKIIFNQYIRITFFQNKLSNKHVKLKLLDYNIFWKTN
jgi:hypothetical protein